MPVSIVRPSIIESAWAEPRPGWIRGFRMAEPVLISYARGLLREFPGVPEGIVDVIPVDLVVAAIITVAALGPDEAPPICQVASGGINPLKYRVLVDNVSGWFTEHPIYDSDGQPIVVPEFRFPGRGRVQGQLTPGQGGDQPRREGPPGPPPPGQAGRAVGEAGDQAAWRSSGRSSTSSCTACTPSARPIYQVDNLMAMWDGSTPTTGRRSTSTRAASTGSDVHPRHPPALDRPARQGQDRAGQDDAPTAPSGCAARCSTPDRHLAAFDLENTLIASNVVESYSFLATRRLDNGERLRYVLRTHRRGAAPAQARPHRPHRLPAPLLSPLRERPRRADRRGRPGAADAT